MCIRDSAGIQIKDLAQGHVQRTDATANGCGEGALDGHAVGADRLEGVLRQVLVGAVEVASFIAGVNLEPFDAFAAAVRALATAASSTFWVAGQMSTPVPSPRMKGMIGLSATTG